MNTALGSMDKSTHTVSKATASFETANPFVWRLILAASHLCVITLLSLLLTPPYALAYISLLALYQSVHFYRRASRRSHASKLKFTRDGKYIVALSMGVGLAAINTGNNLLYLLLGMLLALIITSGILSELSLKGLKLTRSFPEHIFAKQPVLVAVTLKNLKRFMPSFSIQMNDLLNEQGRTKRCFFLKAAAQSEQTTGYRAEFSQRGHYVFRTVTLLTRFPFSFFIKRREVANETSVIVFPAIHSFEALPPALARRQGDAPSQHQGTGREFFGLADYKPGQNSRDIHWRRSAAVDRLVLREYGAEVSITQGIYLNDILPPHETEAKDEQIAADVELCIEYACSLAVRAVTDGQALTVVTRQGAWPIHGDGKGLYPCLKALAVLNFLADDAAPRSTSLQMPTECYVISLNETLHLAPTVPRAQMVTP
jgi:uncharacterized protein (DUF58 family)